MQVTLGSLPEDGDALPFEVVERKGLGHPDTICDALAEQVSLRLSRFYVERFGLILHHNVDKVLLVGGQSAPAFGGGAIRAPMEIVLAGRATREFRGVRVPVDALAEEACRAWLAAHLHALDARSVQIRVRIHPGSPDLVDLYLRQRRTGTWLANDTSCGVGFAPLSRLERAVIASELQLNSAAVRTSCPALGEDVKVLGARAGAAVALTVACAIVDRHVADLDAYRAATREASALARHAAAAEAGTDVAVTVNAADDPDAGSVYLTVTGTSAEAGDDGEAGRGNRVNGLITPYRPMTMESVAGKNPVTHVGKLYNLAAALISEALAATPEVAAASCVLASQIGQPVTEPPYVDVRLRTADRRPAADLRGAVLEAVHAELRRIPAYADELLTGTLACNRWPLREQPMTGTRRPAPAGAGPR